MLDINRCRRVPCMTRATQSTIRDSGVFTTGRIGTQNMQGPLTVRQSVLERVDAVENDDTWKGDLSEHTCTGGPRSEEVGSGKSSSIQQWTMRASRRVFCIPAAKKGVIGVAMDKCVSLSSPAVVPHTSGSQHQAHLPSMAGNFFPRRDIVEDGAKTR